MKCVVSAVCLLALVSLVTTKPSPQASSNCKFYCQKPGTLTYGCCDDKGTNTGKCPPVRLVCPAFGAVAPPNVCFTDNECRSGQKCCRDTCLGHKTCKPVVQ